MNKYIKFLKVLLAVDFVFVLTFAWLGVRNEHQLSNERFTMTFQNTSPKLRNIEVLDKQNPGNMSKEQKQTAFYTKKVIPMGNTTGIYVNTDGILVIDTSEVTDCNGMKCRPAKNLIFPGDYIISVNHERMKTKKQLIEKITNCSGSSLLFDVIRNESKKTISVDPVLCPDYTYKVGIWVRDDLQGLGTITYLDGKKFGALGHSINDLDIGELIDVSKGRLYEANIFGVKRGLKGNPGVIEGMITYDDENVFGTVTNNNQYGIYGEVNEEWIQNQGSMIDNAISVGKPIVGDAQIQSYVSGKKNRYNIYINKIVMDKENYFEIEIKDSELVELTGGIVQGMSGSPVIQNGRIVGAVTHVFVDDPTRGYAIFIEEMLEDN